MRTGKVGFGLPMVAALLGIGVLAGNAAADMSRASFRLQNDTGQEVNDVHIRDVGGIFLADVWHPHGGVFWTADSDENGFDASCGTTLEQGNELLVSIFFQPAYSALCRGQGWWTCDGTTVASFTLPDIAVDALVTKSAGGTTPKGDGDSLALTLWAVDPVAYTDLQIVSNIPQSYWSGNIEDGLAHGDPRLMLVAPSGTFYNGGTVIANLPAEPGLWAVSATFDGVPVVLATNAVPEPATMALLSAGLAVMMGRRRRRAD